MTIANLCMRRITASFAVLALSFAPLLKAVPVPGSEATRNGKGQSVVCRLECRRAYDWLSSITPLLSLPSTRLRSQRLRKITQKSHKNNSASIASGSHEWERANAEWGSKFHTINAKGDELR
jgi:hypothetical protein